MKVLSKLYPNNSVSWPDRLNLLGHRFGFQWTHETCCTFYPRPGSYPPEVIQVSVQHSKALPFHSSSQHLLCGHGGNSNCHGSPGKRRECWSRTTQTRCALHTGCATGIHWIAFTMSLFCTSWFFFKAATYFLVMLLVCKVFQRIPRINGAGMKRRLCSDTFLLLMNYLKHMHCQKRPAVRENQQL